MRDELLECLYAAGVEQRDKPHAQNDHPWAFAQSAQSIEKLARDAKEEGAVDPEYLHAAGQGIALMNVF